MSSAVTMAASNHVKVLERLNALEMIMVVSSNRRLSSMKIKMPKSRVM